MVEASEILVEAESFHQKGGWVVDQQFMDQMGSSYLLAHGMGKPVDDATTTIHVKEGGLYYIYVRTYNWTAPWSKKSGPGRFSLSVNVCFIVFTAFVFMSPVSPSTDFTG